MALPTPILITGGQGALAGALSARTTGHLAPAKSELDVTDAAALTAFFQTHRPAVVVNCAALTNVDRCETEPELANAVNGHAVGQLARLCQQYDAYLVHISTDYVFDGTSSRPYLPTDRTNPISAYGRSKLLGETLLQENAPDRWLIVRTAWLYGDTGASFPRAIVNAARAGKALRVVDDQVGCPTYCPDLADALVQMVARNVTGIHHVVNAGHTSRFDFAAAVLDAFDLCSSADLQAVTTAEWAAQNPGRARRPLFSVLDSRDYTERTGQAVRRWQDALADYRRTSDNPVR